MPDIAIGMKVAILAVLFIARVQKCVSAEKDFCGPPPDIDDAITPDIGGQISEGTVITYGCNYGYLPEGSRTSECVRNEDGILEWSEPVITCAPKSCGFPGFVTNANRVGSVFTYPHSVTFECEEGYKLVGNRQRYCQTNGKWSGKLPSCKRVTCPDPQSPENGRAIFSSVDFGSELKYECSNGYLLKVEELRFCSADGKWSGSMPECSEAHCVVPNPPEFGTMELVGNRATIGSIILYTCNEGKKLIGSGTSKCLSTREWTFPPPQCVEPCTVPAVSRGEIRVKKKTRITRRVYYETLPIGTAVEDGEELFLKCMHNYEPLGKPALEAKITCSEGVWSAELECKPASCRSQPPTVANGRISSVNTDHGGTVVYVCLLPFTKVKYGGVTCKFGQWSGPLPVCKDERCDVTTLKFPGLHIGNSKRYYKNEETFTPVCTARYKISRPNNHILKCVKGTWTGHLPPCTADGCTDPPPRIEHGYYNVPRGDHGSFATYGCNPPYYLEETGKVQCNFGQWDGTPPKCKDGRCYQRDLTQNKGIVYIPNDVTHNGNQAAIECQEGFELRYALPTCSNGVWIEQNVSPCAPKGCIVPGIDHGHLTFRRLSDVPTWNYRKRDWERTVIYTTVERASYRDAETSLFVYCYQGFVFRGNAKSNLREVKCTNGKWTPEPMCLKRGTLPPKEHSKSTETEGDEEMGNRHGNQPTEPVPSTVTMPTVSEVDVTAPESQESFDMLDDNCSCTYSLEDKNVLAYLDRTLLSFGSKVKDGDTVKFHCFRHLYSRLVGQSEVRCESCRNWHSSEFPTCADPVDGDIVILWEQNNDALRLVPNGEFSATPDSSLSFICAIVNGSSYPTWYPPRTAHIKIGYEEEKDPNDSHKPILLSVLEIPRTDSADEGYFECADERGDRKGFYLKTQNTIEYCSEILKEESVEVRYDNEMKVNSDAVFSCKNPEQQMYGASVVSCLPNGDWSEVAPICEDVRCPELKESEGLAIAYTKDRRVGSRATFHCFVPHLRIGAAQVICQKDGSWSGPVSSCTLQDCLMEDLFKKIPEGVVPKVDDVTNETMPYDSILRIGCDSENLRLDGATTVRCGNNGEWDVGKVKCVPGCSALTKPVNSSLIIEPLKDLYRYGEFSIFSCPEGQILDSEVERIMCLNIGWSGPPGWKVPDCVKQ